MEEIIKEIYGDLLLQVTKLQTQLSFYEAQVEIFEDLKNKSEQEVKDFVASYTRNR